MGKKHGFRPGYPSGLRPPIEGVLFAVDFAILRPHYIFQLSGLRSYVAWASPADRSRALGFLRPALGLATENAELENRLPTGRGGTLAGDLSLDFTLNGLSWTAVFEA